MPDTRENAVRPSEPSAASRDTGSSVERCVSVIRQMIFSGDLTPGQQLLQADLAAEFQVSRVPIREALARLHAEGLLAHKSNAGFTVARFSADALSEIYLMRRLLETQLLVTADLQSIDVHVLEESNARLRATVPRDATDVFEHLNVEFHFTVFAASPLELVRQEVARLWNLSAYYRSLRLVVSDDAAHICDEHESIIAAVRRRSIEELIAASDRHRSGTEHIQVPVSGRRDLAG